MCVACDSLCDDVCFAFFLSVCNDGVRVFVSFSCCLVVCLCVCLLLSVVACVVCDFVCEIVWFVMLSSFV